MIDRLRRSRLMRTLSSILSFLILLTTVACGVSSDTSSKTNRVVERDCDYFETVPVIPEAISAGNYMYTCSDAATNNGVTAILLNYSDTQTGEIIESTVAYLADEGQTMRSLSLRDDTPDYTATSCMYFEDGRLAVLGYSSLSGNLLQILSADGTAIERTLPLSGITDNLIDVYRDQDRWIFLTYDSFLVADSNGQNLFRQPLDAELVGYEIFSYNGKPAVWVDDTEKLKIQTLDIEKKTCEKVSVEDSVDRDLFLASEKNGEYLINSAGVYRLDLAAGNRVEVAAWSSIDIPPSTSVFSIPRNIIMDENTILRVEGSVAAGRSDEINLLIHRDVDPNANKKTLTIGGYGVTQGDLLKYAAYLYNTGDYGYRVELVDYNDKYMFEDNESMRRANLNIIKDMSEGKGDDMLSGIFFDFATLGRAGTVLDLLPLAQKDADFKMDSFLPSITELLKTDDKLYQIAPSFTMTGFVGYSDLLNHLEPLTIDRASIVAQNLGEGQFLMVNSYRINLAILAIQYRLDDYLTEDGDFEITTDELTSILSFADAVGMPDDFTGQSPIHDPNAAYVTDKLLLLDSFINSPYAYNQYEQMGNKPMTFFGIPSLKDSARICAPRDLVAVSAASEDPEACWEFIKLLFSLDAQRRAMLEDCIPVSTIAFEEQIAKAMDPSLMTPDDKVAAMQSQAPQPMSAETAQSYRECVNSLNSINCYNIEIGNILWEEFNSFYFNDKPIAEVRETVMNRINLYLDEK